MSSMNRKEFLERSAVCLLACGLASDIPLSLGAEEKNSASKEEPDMNFAHAWVIELLKNMDSQLDESQRVKLMEVNGRACARRDSIAMANQNKGQMGKFLKVMERHLGKGNARKEGNTITLIYPHCFCPLVKSDSSRLSDTYCNCSVGWVKEMLEAVSGKSVQVELLKSVKRGGDCCHFVATI